MKLPLQCIVFCLLLSSCSAPKFYRENEKCYLQVANSRHFNPHLKYFREINMAMFKKFEEISYSTNHICYVKVPDMDINSHSFTGLIYDYDNNKYFKIENNSGRPNDTNITEVHAVDKSDYNGYVLLNYLEGKINYLEWLGDTMPWNGTTRYNFIYNIDLKEQDFTGYRFEIIFFIDDIPFLETEDGRKMMYDMKIKSYGE